MRTLVACQRYNNYQNDPEYVIVFSFFKSCMERGRKAVGVVVYMIVAVLRSYIHSQTLN
jgi:hypothetical protein